MNFSVYNNTFPIGSLYANMTSGIKSSMPVNFKHDAVSVGRDLDKLLDNSVITDMINSNPVITKMLKDRNIQP